MALEDIEWDYTFRDILAPDSHGRDFPNGHGGTGEGQNVHWRVHDSILPTIEIGLFCSLGKTISEKRAKELSEGLTKVMFEYLYKQGLLTNQHYDYDEEDEEEDEF